MEQITDGTCTTCWFPIGKCTSCGGPICGCPHTCPNLFDELTPTELWQLYLRMASGRRNSIRASGNLINGRYVKDGRRYFWLMAEQCREVQDDVLVVIRANKKASKVST